MKAVVKERIDMEQKRRLEYERLNSIRSKVMMRNKDRQSREEHLLSLGRVYLTPKTYIHINRPGFISQDEMDKD